jgi:hypothetical protein
MALVSRPSVQRTRTVTEWSTVRAQLRPAYQTGNQAHDEQDQEDEEQEARDLNRDNRNTAKTQHARDKRDHKENQSVMKHDAVLQKNKRFRRCTGTAKLERTQRANSVGVPPEPKAVGCVENLNMNAGALAGAHRSVRGATRIPGQGIEP